MHKYTNLEILPNGNLKVTLTEDGKNELPDLKEKYGENDEAIIIDLLEYNLCNGYSIVAPEHIGALTASLMIADSFIDEETTQEELDRINVWWFPNYMVQSYLDGIDSEGVIFTKAT